MTPGSCHTAAKSTQRLLLARWVKFPSHLSTAFTTSNGVRQGGILSPLFFNVYMDDLSSILNNAKVGCTINEVIINHLMCADDKVLALHSLVNIHSLKSGTKRYIYNGKKLVFVKIGDVFQPYIHERDISSVPEIKHAYPLKQGSHARVNSI